MCFIKKEFLVCCQLWSKKILEELSINNKRLDLCRKFSGSLPGFPNTGLSRKLRYATTLLQASTPYRRWLLSYTTFSWYNNNVVSKGNTVLCEKKILTMIKRLFGKWTILECPVKFKCATKYICTLFDLNWDCFCPMLNTK